jgi:hypothetical protein
MGDDPKPRVDTLSDDVWGKPEGQPASPEGEGSVSARNIHGLLAAGDDGMSEVDIKNLVENADRTLWQGSGDNLARVYLRGASDGTFDVAIRQFPVDGPITSFRDLSQSSLDNRIADGRWYDTQ